MSTAVVAWDVALGSLEAHLDRVEDLLALGDVEGLADPAVVAGLAPAPVDGPLPSDLTDRALRVRHRTEELVDAVTQRLGETGLALHAGETTRRRAPRTVPAYLDERA